jgi:hypothetical protein
MIEPELLFVPIAERNVIATTAFQSGNKNSQSSFNNPSFFSSAASLRLIKKLSASYV